MANNSGKHGRTTGDPMNLILGLAALAVGVFLVIQNSRVSAVWHTWYIGSFGLPTGVVVVPLLAGLAMLFYNSKSIAAWVVLIAGGLFLLVTILLSVRIYFVSTSLFNYILMFGCIAAGIGFMLRGLIGRKKAG